MQLQLIEAENILIISTILKYPEKFSRSENEIQVDFVFECINWRICQSLTRLKSTHLDKMLVRLRSSFKLT